MLEKYKKFVSFYDTNNAKYTFTDFIESIIELKDVYSKIKNLKIKNLKTVNLSFEFDENDFKKQIKNLYYSDKDCEINEKYIILFLFFGGEDTNDIIKNYCFKFYKKFGFSNIYNYIYENYSKDLNIKILTYAFDKYLIDYILQC